MCARILALRRKSISTTIDTEYRKETFPININSIRIDSPEHKARLVVFLGLVPLMSFGLLKSLQFAWVCDDAFLSFRYAENFINVLGLV